VLTDLLKNKVRLNGQIYVTVSSYKISAETNLSRTLGGLALPQASLVLAPGRRSKIFPAFYIFKYEAKTGDKQLDH